MAVMPIVFPTMQRHHRSSDSAADTAAPGIINVILALLFVILVTKGAGLGFIVANLEIAVRKMMSAKCDKDKERSGGSQW